MNNKEIFNIQKGLKVNLKNSNNLEYQILRGNQHKKSKMKMKCCKPNMTLVQIVCPVNSTKYTV